MTLSRQVLAFYKKIADRLASAIACTLIPRMVAYVSKFIKLTQMTPVIFSVLVHYKLSNVPLTNAQIIGATGFVDSSCYLVSFSTFRH